MPKAKTSSAAALVVVTDGAVVDKSKLAKLQASALDLLALIYRNERETSQRRIVLGLALLCIKDSLKHGEWTPWLKKNAKGSSHRQCNYMMSAALAFRDQAKSARAEIAALPTGDLSLAVANGAKGKLAVALDKFVGDQTWGELLDAHGIKETGKIGGARNVTPVAPDAPADPEQLYIGARDEIGSMIEHAETLLVKENRLAHLVGHPDEVRGVVDSLRSLANKVEAAAQPLLTAKPTA